VFGGADTVITHFVCISMGDLHGGVFMEDRLIFPASLYAETPDPASIGNEVWSVAEEAVGDVICCIHPTLDSEEKRKDVIDYIQRLIRGSLGCEVFPYGSVPLKTYLPDGDIDLTALSSPNFEESLARDVLAVLKEEEYNQNAEFELRDTQFIDAEVKLVKCLVQNIVIDISFNQLGGLCTLCFLEQVDRLVGKNHLFKRSIILIKAWCYYESRILGAHHGLISTYALETLVLYIFHLFNSSLEGPLSVFYMFLDYFSKFDWDNYCISLNGPVRKSSLPDIVVEKLENRGDGFMLSEEFVRNCVDMFSVPSKATKTNSRAFAQKHLNIIDPLKENNNLGRSVHKGNYYRIRSAFKHGARKLGQILLSPKEAIPAEINKFFSNTMKRHARNSGPHLTNNLFTFDDDFHLESYDTDFDTDIHEVEEKLNLALDFREKDSVNGGSETIDSLSDTAKDSVNGDCETIDPLSDLSGDYDGHIRSLLYAQFCNGVHATSAPSPRGQITPRQQLQNGRNPLSRKNSMNGMGPSSKGVVYPTKSLPTSPRGIGTFIPNVENCSCSGRRPRSSQGRFDLVQRDTRRNGVHQPHHESDSFINGRKDISKSNGVCLSELEFGSIPCNVLQQSNGRISSPSLVTPLKPVLTKNRDRSSSAFRLKNEDDFPPLSQ
jgi:hypothetical protein